MVAEVTCSAVRFAASSAPICAGVPVDAAAIPG